jgi:hypothetical protein
LPSTILPSGSFNVLLWQWKQLAAVTKNSPPMRQRIELAIRDLAHLRAQHDLPADHRDPADDDDHDERQQPNVRTRMLML